MNRPRISRVVLDAWLPTLVRYLGFLTAFYAVFVDHLHNPMWLPAATGMLVYKTVVGGPDKDRE